VLLSPYLDEHAASLSNSVLCPHYAESDVSDTPSSPASIESFSILDPIAWRRGYTSYDYGDDQDGRLYRVVRKRLRKNRAQILTAVVFFTLLVVGCAAGGWAILQHENSQLEGICMTREGGDRCQEQAWARCVAVNGVGYCEGVL
jgi:hypothetical protein